MAMLWQLKGAKYLHVVDLDGALTGEPKNLKYVFDMVKALRIPIELGGGIREYSVLKKILDKGVRRVILGTSEHSFHASGWDPDQAAGLTTYGKTKFASALWQNNVFATQFHPEKSQRHGLASYRNFWRLAQRASK